MTIPRHEVIDRIAQSRDCYQPATQFLMKLQQDHPATLQHYLDRLEFVGPNTPLTTEERAVAHTIIANAVSGSPLRITRRGDPTGGISRRQLLIGGAAGIATAATTALGIELLDDDTFKDTNRDIMEKTAVSSITGLAGGAVGYAATGGQNTHQLNHLADEFLTLTRQNLHYNQLLDLAPSTTPAR